MDYANQVIQKADSGMKTLLQNPYVMAVLKVTLILYAVQYAPRLPKSVTNVMNNTFFKIFALFLIMYLSERDFQLAIIFAVVFVLGANVLSGRGFLESFADFSKDFKPSGATLIEPKLAVYPGCNKITMNDLIAAFDGDVNKLASTVQYTYVELLSNLTDKNSKERLMKIAYAVGLPHNIEFNDENAPYIATLLMYFGFQFGVDCHAPQ